MEKGKRSLLKISISELKVLTLLAKNEGLFGSEIVHHSDGFLTRGPIYVSLGRLLEKGCITSVLVPACAKHKMNRPRYKITEKGLKVMKDLAEEFGFMWN